MNHNIINLIGKRFGRLIVLSRHGSITKNGIYRAATWACRCDCGGLRVVETNSLTAGRTRSCGCTTKQTEKHIGKKIYRFTIINIYKKEKNTMVVCKCSCGTIKHYSLREFMKKRKKSCGCIRREWMAATAKRQQDKREKELLRIAKAKSEYKYIPREDLTGKTFGCLTVRWFAGASCDYTPGHKPSRSSLWYCECICGKGVVRGICPLKNNPNISCGCTLHEMHSINGKKGNIVKAVIRKDLLAKGLIKPNRAAIERKDEEALKTFKKAVQNKCYGMCAICSIIQPGVDGMHVHHLKAFNKFPELRILPVNGVYLCRDHHMAFHKQYGFTNAGLKDYLGFKYR